MSASRWRGLQRLVEDAVEHGSRAIERVQVESARRPFAILESLPGLGPFARAVHALHDASSATTHLTIRGVNSLVGVVLRPAIDRLERGTTAPSGGPAGR